MTDKPTGGPAFPQDSQAGIHTMRGMTLRQWFAGQAMAGYCACPDLKISLASIVGESYRTVDAMIAEGEK
jgi:hypothetical protein